MIISKYNDFFLREAEVLKVCKVAKHFYITQDHCSVYIAIIKPINTNNTVIKLANFNSLFITAYLQISDNETTCTYLSKTDLCLGMLDDDSGYCCFSDNKFLKSNDDKSASFLSFLKKIIECAVRLK